MSALPVPPPARLRVAVLDDYQSVALTIADWSPIGAECDVISFTDHADDSLALIERLSDFDVVVAMRERSVFDKRVLDALPRLKLLVTTGMANASIDMNAARTNGVVVSGAELSNHATIELAWALIMAVARDVTLEDRAVREGRWQTTVGLELNGATLGVLGLGRLGRQVADIAKVFGMRVLAWSPNLTPERAEAAGVEFATRADFFDQSDVVSIHMKLADSTRDLVGVDELRMLGPRGRLVNTSRGPIVTETALVEALREGRIAAAALDTFDVEPLPPNHPLLTTPHTLLSPHLGYVSEKAYQHGYAAVVEDIRAWIDGAPIRVLNGA